MPRKRRSDSGRPGVVKTIPRIRFYVIRIEDRYARRYTPEEERATGAFFDIGATLGTATRFEALVDAEEDLALLLSQLRTVPGYQGRYEGKAGAIEQFEWFAIARYEV